MLNEHIWFNPNIRINNSSVFIKSYFNSGYKFIKDLMTDEGNFISIETLRNSNVKTFFFRIHGFERVNFREIESLK